jgi:hypothetical protein
MVAAFLVLRVWNVYGDPRPWSTDGQALALLSFLRTTKYPASLLFLLMTLGPAFLVLAWCDRRTWSPTNPLVVIGRVPLFFFLAHFALAHLLAVPFAWLRYGNIGFLLQPMPSLGGAPGTYPAGFGYSLPVVYAVWMLVLLISWPACVWFARLKTRHTHWSFSYL